MKKSHLILFIAGALVAIGMSMLYIGSTFIAQQTTTTEGTANLGSPVELTREFDPQVAKVGFFVIIAEGFENGELKATIFDPTGSQIATSEIKQKSTQQEFELKDKGNYKLVLENAKPSDVMVVLGLAYAPDTFLVALSYLGFYMIVAGFLGVGAAGIYEFKSRRKSS
jgi:hypothetical protein